MRLYRVLIAGVLFFSPHVSALVPESGLYYDKMRPGLGYYIEVQGTTLVLTVYGYLKTGEPVFYLAAGTIVDGPHGHGQVLDPPAPLKYDFPLEYFGTLYQSSNGPCVSCAQANWQPSQHTAAVGEAFVRMVDYGRLYVAFEMSDGSTIGSYVQRIGFGTLGYTLRPSSALNPADSSMPSFIGTWVFTEKDNPAKQPWIFHFTEIEGPYVSSIDLFSPYGKGQTAIRFMDSSSDAILTCFWFGCGLEQNGEVAFYIKFWDVAMGHALDYIGEELYADDYLSDYRSDQLVVGVRIGDPIPDALPPPEEESW